MRHTLYIKRMKTNNNMNITRVVHMTMQERKNLLQRMEHRNQWKQVNLKALEFFTEIETNNNADPTMTTKKRTMQTVQKEADCHFQTPAALRHRHRHLQEVFISF